MDATVNASGETVVGEVKGDSFVVQHGPDFDATHTVYVLDEITLNPSEDALDNVTELDAAYSDTPDARQDVLECMSADELHGIVLELGPALVRYAEAVHGLDDALADVVEGKW